ncbi:MAG: protoporphyrinogen oxidase HemJ [Nitratireductor sp.]|nr:protoporphyrinogen oxidase HemJ [Nitratireductor sp.]
MYEWIKVLHVVSVISWMVGFLYLPRLMVYHNETEPGSETSETFKVMERRLLKAIMTPAMIASWIFGLWLMVILEAWQEGWFVSKLFLVLLLSAFHGFATKWVREFAADERKRKTRFYRFANEVPTLLMILVVILVIVKPF